MLMELDIAGRIEWGSGQFVSLSPDERSIANQVVD